MKGLVTDGRGGIFLREDIPMPEMGEYDALVKTVGCGICNGTDLKLAKGHLKGFGTYPAVLGHEAVGRVIRTGRKVKNYRLDDIVLRRDVYKRQRESTQNSFWRRRTENAPARSLHHSLPGTPARTQKQKEIDKHWQVQDGFGRSPWHIPSPDTRPAALSKDQPHVWDASEGDIRSNTKANPPYPDSGRRTDTEFCRILLFP